MLSVYRKMHFHSQAQRPQEGGVSVSVRQWWSKLVFTSPSTIQYVC